MRAGIRVERCVISQEVLDAPDERLSTLLGQLSRSGCSVHGAAATLIEAETGGRSLGPILGLARLPAPADLADLVDRAGPRAVLLVAVDVEDPGNVGALVRTALASGTAGMACVGISDPFHPRAIRTSMGSVFRLPILAYESATTLMRELSRTGVTALASVSRGGTPLPELDQPDGPVALLVGREAFGLPGELRSLVPRDVTIPMGSSVDSFSVHAAAAILLYALTRGNG